MQINPVSHQSVVTPAATAGGQSRTAPVQEKAAPIQDTADLSQKSKDLAAQLTGKTQQEEAKESPVVEANEEQAKK